MTDSKPYKGPSLVKPDLGPDKSARAEPSQESAPRPYTNGNGAHVANHVANGDASDLVHVAAPKATRKDLQLGRRGFHMVNGVVVASAYWAFFSHSRAVYLLGTMACLTYIFEQVRISYPELTKKTAWITNFFLRAEEQFKESAMIPYAIALLLTIITFPQPIALIAIYTLALADPLSAIIGIKFGRHHIVKEKSLEGSAAFFVVACLCSFVVLSGFGAVGSSLILASILIGGFAAAFEMLPLKIDDNLTIPIFVGFIAWMITSILGIHFPV